MKRGLLVILCMLFVFSANISVLATDTPYIPDDNTSDGCGPYTDPDTSDDNSSPDSTDSGDSWDNGSNNTGDYGDGYSNGGVYY